MVELYVVTNGKGSKVFAPELGKFLSIKNATFYSNEWSHLSTKSAKKTIDTFKLKKGMVGVVKIEITTYEKVKK